MDSDLSIVGIFIKFIYSKIETIGFLTWFEPQIKVIGEYLLSQFLVYTILKSSDMNTIMVQGTTSDAGKSTMSVALCRALKRRNVSVVPFKPQNMALNSAVTSDGGEIGRAQALQAVACGVLPCVDMNPVLLKPETDVGAQVIISGRSIGNMSAREFHQFKPKALESVLVSHQRLSEMYSVVVVEGAGSPAEINLREHDIANMGFAEAIDCPVILVADIDKGGVFAHIVGTLALLSETERERVKGFIINSFRGDIELLRSGLDWLENYTGKPVLGVMPYLPNLHLDAEDSVSLGKLSTNNEAKCKIVVPVLPRISNHTDFDPLSIHPDIELIFVREGESVPPSDLIILPGSKSVRSDMQFLFDQGWKAVIEKHLRYGGKLIGICGGFQMLGEYIDDPQGIEGLSGGSSGFGFLKCKTVLKNNKQLHNRQGNLSISGESITGYEIHSGITEGEGLSKSFIESESGSDGAISEDGKVAGSYWHGLFESSDALLAIMAWVGFKVSKAEDFSQVREYQIDRLTDVFEEHVDMSKILSLLEAHAK